MKSNYIKMFLAMLIVGSSVVSNKMLVEHVPVFIASELRFAIATIILISLLCKYEGIPKVRAKELLILFLQALTGVFLFSVCMLYGLKHTTALEGGIITSTLPAVMAILAFIVLKERPSLKVLIGIGLTMIGLTFIQTTGSTHSQWGIGSLIGNLLILCAVISEAMFILLGKISSKKHSPLVITTMVSAIGTILFLPFAIFEFQTFSIGQLTLIDYGLITYNGLFVTVIAFLLMYQAVREIPAYKAGVLSGVIPISAAVFSFGILNESLTISHFIGMVVVLCAIYLITNEKSREDNDNKQRMSKKR